MKRLLSIYFLLGILLFGCKQKSYHGDIIISNTSIIDVESLTLLANKTILIEDGIIKSIIPFSADHKYESEVLIDGKNMFVIPGLWDMHTHYVTTNDRNDFWRLFTANGILGVRELWGVLENRDSILLNNPLSPKIYLSGAIFDGEVSLLSGILQPKDDKDAIRLIDSLYKHGADFIKVYDDLSPGIYKAIANRCNELNLPFAGHVPDEITAVEASNLGQRSIEHLNGIFESCSNSQNQIDSLELVFKNAYSRGDISTALAAFTGLLKMYSTSFSESELNSLSAVLKRNNTFVTPTLIVSQKNWYRNKTDYSSNPNNRYISKSMLEQWDPKNDFPANMFTSETWLAGQQMVETAKKITNKLYNQGVILLAGSDCGVSYVVPGFSLHEELVLLVKSGLSNGAALQTATINPAKFLKISDSAGTVTAGKFADLVLLQKNPLEDISHTTTIMGIIKQGKYLDRKKLDDLLTQLK